MVLAESDAIESLQILTSVGSIQTEDEYEATRKKTPMLISLILNSQNYLQAGEELANDLTRLKLTLTLFREKYPQKRALSYLIADYTQISLPEWNSQKVQYNEDSSFIDSRTEGGLLSITITSGALENALKADSDYKERRAGVCHNMKPRLFNMPNKRIVATTEAGATADSFYSGVAPVFILWSKSTKLLTK